MRQPLIIPIRNEGREGYQNFSEWEFWHKGRRFIVEEGFFCDGASVPRLLWPFMPPDGLHRPAALAHDRVFAGHVIDGYRFTLWEADLMFLRLMLEAGVHPGRARIAWAGLKFGSWYAWTKGKDSKPIVLPVINAAPTLHPKATKNRLTRHIYATVLTP